MSPPIRTAALTPLGWHNDSVAEFVSSHANPYESRNRQKSRLRQETECLTGFGTGRSVLLISLVNSTDNLGVKSIHASLLERGHDSHLLFYVSEGPSYFNRVADFVRDHHISAVGVSLMSRHFPLAAGITESIKSSCDPSIPVVWGGIHPTIDPASAASYADYVCVGDGETAFCDFIENSGGKSLQKDIAGIGPPHSSGHPIEPSVADVEALPLTQFIPRSSWITDSGQIRPLSHGLVKAHNRNRGAYLGILTSRGCPFSCSYCCNNLLHKIYGKQIRKRKPEQVIQEIEEALSSVNTRFRYINIYDDCFIAHSVEWLETFVSQLKSIRIPLVFRAIPQFLTKEKLRILKEAPVGMTVLGLQSGSARTLKDVYQRKHSTKALKSCAQLLDEHDVPAVYDVIVDNPYETRSDIRETVKLVSELPRTAYICMFSLTFYRHTDLYNRARQDGLPVDEHLTKNQDGWEKDSLEVNALKTAALVSRKLALKMLGNPSGLAKLKLRLVSKLAVRFLEPMRYLRMLYLSHGRRKTSFLILLALHARDYAHKYFSRSRRNKQAH